MNQRHRDWPAWSSSAFGLEDNSRQVVLNVPLTKGTYRIEEFVNNVTGRVVPVPTNQIERAFQAEQPPVPRHRLHDPVGVQKDQFARLKLDRRPCRKLAGLVDTHKTSRAGKSRLDLPLAVQNVARAVTGVGVYQ